MTAAEWDAVLILCEPCAQREKVRRLRGKSDDGSVSLCYDGCGIETITSYYAPPEWPSSFPPSEPMK